MSKPQITHEVPVVSTDTDQDQVIATVVARRRARAPYVATAVISVLAVGGLSFLQKNQANGSSEQTEREPAATADMGEVYGPTLAELQAEPVGCTITLETGDTAATVASELLGGENPYGHAILRYVNQQGEGTGSAEGMLMDGQEVDLPISYCGTVIDQAPQEG